MLHHNTQLRHLSAHVLSVCMMRNTADILINFNFQTRLTFPVLGILPAQSLGDQTRKNASCVESFMSTTLADWVPAK